MPLIRIDMLRGKSSEYRAALRDTIYETLRDVVGVPADDRHEVITEHEPDNLNIAPDAEGCIALQGDLGSDHFERGPRHRPQAERALYAAIVKALERRVGLRPDDVTINLLEVKKENWSSGSGIAHYVDAPQSARARPHPARERDGAAAA